MIRSQAGLITIEDRSMKESVDPADCCTQTGFGIYLPPPTWTADSLPDRCLRRLLLFSSLPC